LLVAGQLVTVNQAAPLLADLVPVLSESYCTVSDSNVRFASVRTSNAGPGSAVVPSFTRLVFDTEAQTVSDEIPPLSPKLEDLSIFTLPSTCFAAADPSGIRTCAFTIVVDASNAVYEGEPTTTAELNNTRRGACQICNQYQCGGLAIRSVRNPR